jgi:hypothetical protein
LIVIALTANNAHAIRSLRQQLADIDRFVNALAA